MTRAGAERERGSAVVEMAVLGSAVFAVLVQLVVVFGTAQRAALATSAAAREAARVVVVSDSGPEAGMRARLAVATAERNHGLEPGSLRISVAGTPARARTVRVTVRTSVPILRIPFLGRVGPAVLPVEATQVMRVDPYRSIG